MSTPGNLFPLGIPPREPLESIVAGARREVEAEREEEQTGSRFLQAVEKAGLPTLEEFDVEQLFRDAGVDVTEFIVRGYIDSAAADLAAAETDEERLDVFAELQTFLPILAELHPAVPVQDYHRAMELSGFPGQLLSLGTTTPSEVTQGIPSTGVVGGKGFTVHPETGWIQYANGVLVNPADGGVWFDPTSDTAGSPNWIRSIQSTWSEEKQAEWRQKLHDAGMLTKEQAKSKGWDQVFLNALQSYHVIRYQNFGRFVPPDLAAGAEGTEFALTARDFQTQIRNDVREQYRRVFDQDPSDADLASWTLFVTQTALQAQRRFTRKGATGVTGLSLAATEAEERLIEELEGSPQARYVLEAEEENTRLRDALASAVVTTRSLAG